MRDLFHVRCRRRCPNIEDAAVTASLIRLASLRLGPDYRIRGVEATNTGRSGNDAIAIGRFHGILEHLFVGHGGL